MAFRVTIVTLYPELFPGPLCYSLSGRALEKGLWGLETVFIRDYAFDKHRQVDDTPYGGGAGMVMRADVVARALDATCCDIPRIFLSPQGRPFSQADARRFASGKGITVLCGHFEGVDARLLEARDIEEVSIGDYVLSGGEIAAFPLIDSIVRLLPSVMGNAFSHEEESFENGLLEYPHYTRPRVFEGLEVPEILLSGNHALIKEWRRAQSEQRTRMRRPDLYARYLAKKQKTP